MAMKLNDLEKESVSQSILSDADESDHLEVHNTFKHRGKILQRWKRLVKANSFLFLVFSVIWAADLFLFSPKSHNHNWAVVILSVFAALWGLNTGFSFGDPSPVKIYMNAVITGFTTTVICIYTLVVLSYMVLVSIDDKYEDQKDNFTMKEVSKS